MSWRALQQSKCKYSWNTSSGQYVENGLIVLQIPQLISISLQRIPFFSRTTLELPFSRNDVGSSQLKEGQQKRNNSKSENSNYYWGYAMMKMTNLFWQERIELSKLNESSDTVWTSVLYRKCFSPWPMMKDIYCYPQLTNHLYVKHKWLKVSLTYIS